MKRGFRVEGRKDAHLRRLAVWWLAPEGLQKPGSALGARPEGLPREAMTGPGRKAIRWPCLGMAVSRVEAGRDMKVWVSG